MVKLSTNGRYGTNLGHLMEKILDKRLSLSIEIHQTGV